MLNDTEVQVILSFAKHNMKTAPVARELHYCRQAIDYRLNQIKQKTGLNPWGFFDLCELVEMVKGMA